ncbi:MAG: hypothetical protein H7645_08695 [Candidatus Heimdallarchaeota archaeon]|nr:hypothetical protein [Candidatus Heimdallarchaeota archaeon]MCK4770402.1 hypothetical protein [Candidatus Heimdallarchaeota archaeon]
MSSDDFPLYMSSINVKENEYVEIVVVYQGEDPEIDNVFLIGDKNNLSSDITAAKIFSKEGTARISYTISFPIWEDGTFQAVAEKEGKYIYEPGEAHNIVFRGKGVFLDLRKIYHLTKKVKKPKKGELDKAQTEGEAEEIPEVAIEEDTIEPAFDEDNMLSLKPKDFKVFVPELKNSLLQLLDYLANEKSQKLFFDVVILPDIARNLKLCISEEGRASVYDVCFPFVIFIEKALILSGMIHNQILDEEKYERYKREVVDKIEDVRSMIKATEFRHTTDLIKKEYDDDVHELKMRLREEI